MFPAPVFLHQPDRFLQVEMGNMLFFRSAFNTRILLPRIFFFLFIDPVGIGDVGKITKTKAKHWHAHMPNLNGRNGDIIDQKAICGDIMQGDIGYPGILIFCKYI